MLRQKDFEKVKKKILEQQKIDVIGYPAIDKRLFKITKLKNEMLRILNIMSNPKNFKKTKYANTQKNNSKG